MKQTLARWQAEKTAAYLSSAVARAERDPAKAALFRQLAESAEEQGGILAKRLGQVPRFQPSLRARLTAILIGLFGARAMRHVLSAAKVRGVSVYRGKLQAEGHPMPSSVEEVGQRHKSFGGGTLRAGVFGVNDGLVSNTCLIMGVAGAAVETSVLILTGVAESVSMLSQKEMFQHQIAQEKDELARYPKVEAEELALIFAARGVPIDEARNVATKMIANPEQALDTLAREELGLNPDDLGSPIGAAISSFVTFSIGASLPIIPFLFALPHGIAVAAAISGTALFVVGAALSLFSGRSALLGGLRMLLIGSAAAAATYSIGSLFDVSAA